MKRKEYLGDAVCAEMTNYGDLVLTTENGIAVTNRIVLEPEVIRNMEDFLAAVRSSPARQETK